MKTEMKFEFIALANRMIATASELIEEVCMNDGDRGKFYNTRIAEYLTDVASGQHGIERYVKELETERDQEELKDAKIATSWEQIGTNAPPLGYVPVLAGAQLRKSDKLYIHNAWITLEEAFGESWDAMKKIAYSGRYLLVRRVDQPGDKEAEDGFESAPEPQLGDLQPAGV